MTRRSSRPGSRGNVGNVCGVRAILASLLVGIVLVAAGCGGGDDTGPARSALVERLSRLCEDTRVEVEQLGEPKDEGAAVFRPWSRIGRSFAEDLKRLPAETPGERTQVESLAEYYNGFYDSLRLSYDMFVAHQSVAIKMTLERGYSQLASAEQLAKRMGAAECVVRPFEAQ